MKQRLYLLTYHADTIWDELFLASPRFKTFPDLAWFLDLCHYLDTSDVDNWWNVYVIFVPSCETSREALQMAVGNKAHSGIDNSIEEQRNDVAIATRTARVVQVKFLAPVALGLHCGCELNIWRFMLDTRGRSLSYTYDLPGSQVTRTRSNAFYARLRPPHNE